LDGLTKSEKPNPFIANRQGRPETAAAALAAMAADGVRYGKRKAIVEAEDWGGPALARSRRERRPLRHEIALGYPAGRRAWPHSGSLEPHQSGENRPPRGEYAGEKPYASTLIAMGHDAQPFFCLLPPSPSSASQSSNSPNGGNLPPPRITFVIIADSAV
jgi:hypothetical protein